MDLTNDYESSHINYGISVTDVLKHPLFANCKQDDPRLQDERMLGRALHDLGMDTTYHVASIVCTHRNLQNKVVNTLMYRGKERTDTTWLESGFASEVAKDSVRQQRKENIRKAELDSLKKN